MPMRAVVGRRSAFAVAATLWFVIAAPVAAEQEEPTFPEMALAGSVIDPSSLTYNPTGEFDFPTLLDAATHLDEPLARYYLYTAPHNNPGGISLFFADDLEGPWQEYEHNPIIEHVWEPHYSVSHVSSPHVVWLEDENSLFLYFHGENSTTRYATSTDGIEFTYGGVALHAGDLEGQVHAVSYARVTEHTIPGRDNRYLMTFMDAVPGDGLGGYERRIRLAVSDDARSWSVDPDPLVSPHPSEGTSISGATYFPWNGGHYIAYHGSSGNIFLTDVGSGFDREDHVGILYQPGEGPPENGRAAAPYFVLDGDQLHMFYEVGTRGATTIARAVADLTVPGATLAPLPEPDPDPEPEPARVFTDIARSSAHYDDVHILAANGLTDGCGRWSAHTYCPDRAVTRAEMATFLKRADGLPGASSTRFVDVPSDWSHVPGIAAIDLAGYTNGCGRAEDNTYCPHREVTRAETATFLMRVLALPQPDTIRYRDVPESSSHAPGIEAIARAGLTNGCGPPDQQTYCPERPVTRAEMASFLVRAYGLS